MNASVGMVASQRLQWYVVAMIVTGLGKGLAQPVYTIAVQNVAPRHQMGGGHLVDGLLFGRLAAPSAWRSLAR